MGVIIYTLMSGPKRFHEITEGIPGISDRLLTERLNELIKEGLVIKKQLEPSTIIGYELTDSGMELKEVITAIRNWMAKRTTP
ncbi:helix-turn-helix transcriptional regulator [Sporosarcina sp. E16_3]|nr:helix-turn-helix transcriptional regulator [Sporosarcina sp. E16_3]